MKYAVPTSLVALALSAVACSDDTAGATDAAVDAPPDVAIDAAGCGSEFLLTGEYVDWDSTTSVPTGVFEAKWTLPGLTPRVVFTNPNGRVELCVPPGNGVSNITIMQPDYLPAIFVAQPTVFMPPGMYFTIKGLKHTRAPTFYQSLGLTFDPNRAHVLVQKQGAPTALALTGGGTAFAVDNPDDLTWTAGSSGGLVLFANIDPTDGLATLSGAGLVGPTMLPLVPGTLTTTSVR